MLGDEWERWGFLDRNISIDEQLVPPSADDDAPPGLGCGGALLEVERQGAIDESGLEGEPVGVQLPNQEFLLLLRHPLSVCTQKSGPRVWQTIGEGKSNACRSDFG